MEVRAVHFEPRCGSVGCWVLRATFSTGASALSPPSTFNTFFLPHAVGNDGLSQDFHYDAEVLETFEPSSFPCRVSDYASAEGSVASLPLRSTACCFGTSFNHSNYLPGGGGGSGGAGLLGRYRVTEAFASYAEEAFENLCPGSVFGDVANISNGTPKPEDFFPDGVSAGGHREEHFVAAGQRFVGMTESPGIVQVLALDAFIGQYEATVKLDERELRTKAGLLSGTVGVEHSIDFFLGFANFRPGTGTWILDSLATQAAVHLERTAFFSVSAHGTNDYTFLDYVNLRLISVLSQAMDLSRDHEAPERLVRTNQTRSAHYVQVTFSLAPKYKINSNSGLVPISSVRAGAGIFAADASMHHKCVEFLEAPANEFDSWAAISHFNASLQQPCAPAAAMCSSPQDIPDSFVSFNIPLGFDFLGSGSALVDKTVFVELVVSAVDDDARSTMRTTANDGEDPWQMKTTLSASVPVVDGGVNIFCDGLIVKTDLRELADVDIILGTAMSPAELSRLRFLSDAASTQLQPQDEIAVDSDSLEAGLMTVVLKGKAVFFENTEVNNRLVSLELEDVVTIHLMESDGVTADGDRAQSKQQLVKNLLAESADDQIDNWDLDVDEYPLNGAFAIVVDRSAQRAHLQPSPRLMAACPLNPPRPAESRNVVLETCVSRRDVRFRDFPWRTGAVSTAMELSPLADDAGLLTSSTEALFLTSILGDSDYARRLAVGFAAAVDQHYGLDGRFRRAFWVNPGYEWTPTRTGGASLFQLSQKLFLFALVTLDERLTTDPGSSIFDSVNPRPPQDVNEDGAASPNLPKVPGGSRRRLFTVVDAAKQSALSSAEVAFAVSPLAMLASAFGVPEELAARFRVDMRLAPDEACLADDALQQLLRPKFESHLANTASAFETVQVVAVVVDRALMECGGSRRSESSVPAKVDMVIVFSEGAAPVFHMDSFAQLPGVVSVLPLTSGTFEADRTWFSDPAPTSVSRAGFPLLLTVSCVAGAVTALAVVLALARIRARADRAAIPAHAELCAEVSAAESVFALEALQKREMMDVIM